VSDARQESAAPLQPVAYNAAMPLKIKLLLAVHLAVGIAPAAMFFGGDLRWLPLMWALGGLSLGQLMLLAFWGGMGTTSAGRRLLGMVLGGVYLALWPTVGMILSPYTEGSIAMFFMRSVAMNYAALVIFAGIFLLIRGRFVELRLVEHPQVFRQGRYQFSVLGLLLVTSLIAVVLGLTRAATAAEAAVWHELAATLLAIGAFIANMLAAPWAALMPGPVRLRVALALVIALLLGLALAFAANFRLPFPEWRTWLITGQTLAFALPSLVVILSLLVVRWCGYRLVPRTRSEGG
jgi:hypothetical protein